MNTPNIIGADKDKVFSHDFNLNDWAEIARTLDLIDSDGDDGLIIGEKRAYLIWLWLYTAKERSFEQTHNQGNYQIGVIGKL